MSRSVRGLWTAAVIAAFPLLAEAADSPENPLLRGSEALGDYRTDAPGVRRLITTNDIPAPNTKSSVDKGAHIVPRPPNAWPKVPEGFTVELLASKLDNPRKITTAPNSDIFVAESNPGRITILRELP